MKKTHWSRELVKLHACFTAVKWARRQKTYAQAWNKCKRTDWMRWLVNAIYLYNGPLDPEVITVYYGEDPKLFRKHFKRPYSPYIKGLR